MVDRIRVPPKPWPGAVAVGPTTSPGFFVQQLQRISRGWSETWVRWRQSGLRPVPRSGFWTNDPTLVQDEAAAFVREFSLDDVLQEWQERTQANPATPGGQNLETGRGTRRPRDEWEGRWSGEARTARPRR